MKRGKRENVITQYLWRIIGRILEKPDEDGLIFLEYHI